MNLCYCGVLQTSIAFASKSTDRPNTFSAVEVAATTQRSWVNLLLRHRLLRPTRVCRSFPVSLRNQTHNASHDSASRRTIVQPSPSPQRITTEHCSVKNGAADRRSESPLPPRVASAFLIPPQKDAHKDRQVTVRIKNRSVLVDGKDCHPLSTSD